MSTDDTPDEPPPAAVGRIRTWWRRFAQWLDDDFPREPEDNLPDR